MVGYDRKQLGEYLKASRKGAGLSQKSVAYKLGLGNAQFISNIERGLCAIPAKKLKALLKIYKQDSSPVIDLIAESYHHSLKTYFSKR
jgi:transcriptional regulator with XRE-family HTH domain